MVDLHCVEHHTLAAHHVVVVVRGKMRVQPVRRLRAFPVPDVVGQNEKVLRNVERRARSEKHIGKERIQQRVRVAARPVQQQNRVVHVARGVAVRRSQRKVMQTQLGQRSPASKRKLSSTTVPSTAGHAGVAGAASAPAGIFASGIDMV